MSRKKKHAAYIIWGGSLLETGDRPETYTFDSEAERDAFLSGVQAAFDSDADGFEMADGPDYRWDDERNEAIPPSMWDEENDRPFPRCAACQEEIVDEEGDVCAACKEEDA